MAGYVLVKRNRLKKIRDVKIILGEECFTQHRPLVMGVKLAQVVYSKRQIKLWRMKDKKERERRGGACKSTSHGNIG